MKREEMWHEACKRFEEWACKYADKNVTDVEFCKELSCSVLVGDEFKKEISPLDSNCCFKYKGYDCELTPCTQLVSKQDVLDTADAWRRGEVKNVFSDRYVCWLNGHKDDDGKTEDEVDNPDCWVPKLYLVPNAWAWGAEYDCKPGAEVNDIILDAINEFLKQHPDL